jgi:hypothetical protein
MHPVYARAHRGACFQDGKDGYGCAEQGKEKRIALRAQGGFDG